MSLEAGRERKRHRNKYFFGLKEIFEMPLNLEPVRINSFKQPGSNVLEPISKKKSSKILQLWLLTGKINYMEK